MYEKGQLIAVNGRIYEYDRYDKYLDVHFGTEVEIDEEGILTATCIPCCFSPEELTKGFNKTNFTQAQWYGIVTHLLRQSCKYSEKIIADAAEDIVYRCFTMSMPEFDELQDYIDCYMNR